MRYLLITILAFLLMGASLEDARQANEAYNNGDYKKAISLYKKAIDKDPKNSKLYFNLASAQAKAGSTEEAIRTFEQYKSMTDDPQEEAKANYNIGKVLSDTKKWGKAVDYFKQSLRYMANDADAKHNFELAKKKKKEQQEQQKQNKQQQKNNDQKQNQDQNKKQQDQKKNKDQQKQKQQQNQQQQDQQNQQQQKKKQQQQQLKMSKQEAEKILKALEQKEKDLLKQFKKKKTESSNSKNEKDW